MSTGPSDDARARDQRAARNAAKLRGLVQEHWDVRTDDARAVGTGAAVVAEHRAVVLLDGDHGLGAAMAWARREGSTELHVVVDDDPGTVARQARAFGSTTTVWRSEGRALVEVEPAPVEPGSGPPDAPELVALLEAVGLDVVVEGDRLAGEFRGLEVARVVRALDDDEPMLEVGVGKFDRVLTAMLHGEQDARTSLERVVAQLRDLRRPDGPNHPLAGLVPERWLRATLIAEPGLVGCTDLVAAPTPAPRDELRPRGIAAAIGTRAGEPVVVVTTVGVDLEAPVLAADTRAAVAPDATLLLALPPRDVLPTTEALVADIVAPAEIVPVPDDWRR